MPNKALAATGGSGLAGAIVTVLLSLWGHDVSPETAAALTTIIGSAIAGLSAWIVKMEGA